MYDFIYADPLYENRNIDWVYHAVRHLKDNGILIVQTDYHTVTDYKHMLDRLELQYGRSMQFVNWLVWKNEWGNFRKDRFHQCHDDILVYSKGLKYKFYPDRVQVKKSTVSKGLNPSGRSTKTMTSWIDDICLTTVSKERLHDNNGALQWQKPEELMERLLLAFTDEGDSVLDLFMGTGTLGVVSKRNNRNYCGIEYLQSVYNLAKIRIGNEDSV
jgi:DNA modification methylase